MAGTYIDHGLFFLDFSFLPRPNRGDSSYNRRNEERPAKSQIRVSRYEFKLPISANLSQMIGAGVQEMNKPYCVHTQWDEKATAWVASSDDVPGLATESDTTEALFEKLTSLIPETLDLNDQTPFL